MEVGTYGVDADDNTILVVFPFNRARYSGDRSSSSSACNDDVDLP